jgi:predicted DNA-binding transcriptional regulator AlpA
MKRQRLSPKVTPTVTPTPQPQLDPDCVLLTLREVADHLKLAPRTIRRHVQCRRFPAPIKIGHRLRWRLTDLQYWIAQQRGVAI